MQRLLHVVMRIGFRKIAGYQPTYIGRGEWSAVLDDLAFDSYAACDYFVIASDPEQRCCLCRAESFMRKAKRQSGQPVMDFDADKYYRDSLAKVVLKILAENLAENARLCQDIRALLNYEAYADRNPQQSLSEEALSQRLKRHPHLQSRLALLTQYTTSKWMLQWELISRGCIENQETTADAYEKAKEVKAVGVCLSGGGIRSATFNLGILQGMARQGALRKIDYLSTVSGGGYIQEFLASWIDREGLPSVAEKLNPIPFVGSRRVVPPEPIRWLRRYSNYLSPSVSMLGADMWTIVTVWTRNTLLNLVILITAMMALLLLPHAAITQLALIPYSIGPFWVRLALFLLLVSCALCASVLLWPFIPALLRQGRGGWNAAGTWLPKRCHSKMAHLFSCASLAGSLCMRFAYRLSSFCSGGFTVQFGRQHSIHTRGGTTGDQR